MQENTYPFCLIIDDNKMGAVVGANLFRFIDTEPTVRFGEKVAMSVVFYPSFATVGDAGKRRRQLIIIASVGWWYLFFGITFRG